MVGYLFAVVIAVALVFVSLTTCRCRRSFVAVVVSIFLHLSYRIPLLVSYHLSMPARLVSTASLRPRLNGCHDDYDDRAQYNEDPLCKALSVLLGLLGVRSTVDPRTPPSVEGRDDKSKNKND